MYPGWLQFYSQDAAEDISNVESLEQHEMAAAPDALMDANEEQTDTVDVLDVNTSSNRTGNITKPILNRPTLLLQNR